MVVASTRRRCDFSAISVGSRGQFGLKPMAEISVAIVDAEVDNWLLIFEPAAVIKF